MYFCFFRVCHCASEISRNVIGQNVESSLFLIVNMFHGIMFINFQGTFLLNQALARALVSEKMKPASLVNISSIVGKVSRVEPLPVKLVQRSS